MGGEEDQAKSASSALSEDAHKRLPGHGRLHYSRRLFTLGESKYHFHNSFCIQLWTVFAGEADV